MTALSRHEALLQGTWRRFMRMSATNSNPTSALMETAYDWSMTDYLAKAFYAVKLPTEGSSADPLHADGRPQRGTVALHENNMISSRSDNSQVTTL